MASAMNTDNVIHGPEFRLGTLQNVHKAARKLISLFFAIWALSMFSPDVLNAFRYILMFHVFVGPITLAIFQKQAERHLTAQNGHDADRLRRLLGKVFHLMFINGLGQKDFGSLVPSNGSLQVAWLLRLCNNNVGIPYSLVHVLTGQTRALCRTINSGHTLQEFIARTTLEQIKNRSEAIQNGDRRVSVRRHCAPLVQSTLLTLELLHIRCDVCQLTTQIVYVLQLKHNVQEDDIPRILFFLLSSMLPFTTAHSLGFGIVRVSDVCKCIQFTIAVKYKSPNGRRIWRRVFFAPLTAGMFCPSVACENIPAEAVSGLPVSGTGVWKFGCAPPLPKRRPICITRMVQYDFPKSARDLGSSTAAYLLYLRQNLQQINALASQPDHLTEHLLRKWFGRLLLIQVGDLRFWGRWMGSYEVVGYPYFPRLNSLTDEQLRIVASNSAAQVAQVHALMPRSEQTENLCRKPPHNAERATKQKPIFIVYNERIEQDNAAGPDNLPASKIGSHSAVQTLLQFQESTRLTDDFLEGRHPASVKIEDVPSWMTAEIAAQQIEFQQAEQEAQQNAAAGQGVGVAAANPPAV